MFTNDEIRDQNLDTSFFPLFEAFYKGNIDRRTYEQYSHYRPLALEASKPYLQIAVIH